MTNNNFHEVTSLMTTNIGKKIREIRETENLSRSEFAVLTGIPEGAQKFYETGRRENIGIATVIKITNHPRFEKYTLWLMTGKTSGVSEQVCPDIRGERRIDDQ